MLNDKGSLINATPSSSTHSTQPSAQPSSGYAARFAVLPGGANIWLSTVGLAITFIATASWFISGWVRDLDRAKQDIEKLQQYAKEPRLTKEDIEDEIIRQVGLKAMSGASNNVLLSPSSNMIQNFEPSDRTAPELKSVERLSRCVGGTFKIATVSLREGDTICTTTESESVLKIDEDFSFVTFINASSGKITVCDLKKPCLLLEGNTRVTFRDYLSSSNSPPEVSVYIERPLSSNKMGRP